MIHTDRNYLWEQLNGPQITAFEEAIKQYHKDSYDKVLEYLNNFGIDSENGALLGFIGKLMLNPPPLIVDVTEYRNWFRWSRIGKNPNPPDGDGRTIDPPPKAIYGFSDSQGTGIGGQFPLSDDETYGHVNLPDDQYKDLLQEMAKIDGYTGASIETLDFYADILLRRPGTGEKLYYEISWYDMGIQDTNYGDLLVTLREEVEYPIIVFKLIINTVFQSQPVVYIDINPNIGL